MINIRNSRKRYLKTQAELTLSNTDRTTIKEKWIKFILGINLLLRLRTSISNSPPPIWSHTIKTRGIKCSSSQTTHWAPVSLNWLRTISLWTRNQGSLCNLITRRKLTSSMGKTMISTKKCFLGNQTQCQVAHQIRITNENLYQINKELCPPQIQICRVIIKCTSPSRRAHSSHKWLVRATTTFTKIFKT